jgi:hypothetical protein
MDNVTTGLVRNDANDLDRLVLHDIVNGVAARRVPGKS